MSFEVYQNGEHFFSADHCPESIEGIPDIYMSVINAACKQLEAADLPEMSVMNLTLGVGKFPILTFVVIRSKK